MGLVSLAVVLIAAAPKTAVINIKYFKLTMGYKALYSVGKKNLVNQLVKLELD